LSVFCRFDVSLFGAGLDSVMALNLTDRLPPDVSRSVQLTLSLTAEARTRSRYYFETDEGQGVYLRLPRGTVLRHGELLQSEDEKILVRVIAKPEPVMKVTAQTPLELLRAAYHLGNRHVSLEVRETYLQLSPDPVLKAMLEQLGVQVTETIAPFEPEAGAYGQGHRHSHQTHQTHQTVEGSESHEGHHHAHIHSASEDSTGL
jgi:urease accessory protein